MTMKQYLPPMKLLAMFVAAAIAGYSQNASPVQLAGVTCNAGAQGSGR